MQEIIILLQQFGLTEQEIQVYLGLLELGPSTVLELSKHTRIKRTTVHINIENLIQQGLATETKRGARRLIIAEPPGKLQYLINQKQWEVKKMKESLPKIIGGITNLIPSFQKNTEIDVKFYKGKKVVANIYDEILKSKEVRAYVNASEITKAFPENFNKFVSAARSGKTELWDLLQDTEEAREFQADYRNVKNYHFCFLPLNIKIHSMDYLMYSDTITIIQGGMEPTAILIKNKLLFENAKTLFNLLWGLLDKGSFDKTLNN